MCAANAALAPMVARLASQEDEIMKCKENYMGADDAPKATTAQVTQSR